MEQPIEYWQDLYLLHSESKSFQKKVRQSEQVIQDFLDLGVKAYGSISGGKDSTAMMHLIWSLAPGFPFMSEKDDLDFPNEAEYMQTLKEKYSLNLQIIRPKVLLWDVLENHDFTEDIHSRDTAFSDEHFYKLIKEFQAENNYKGVCLGLRAEESKGRLWNFKTQKYIYYHETEKHLVCQPLAQWSGADVFAYLFSREVPILDVYFKTHFVNSPEEIRKSWVLPSHQSHKGQAQWLKFYYPEIFNRLSRVNDKMRLYV